MTKSPVKLNVFLRTIVVVSAVVLAAQGCGVTAIMLAIRYTGRLDCCSAGRCCPACGRSAEPVSDVRKKQALAEVFRFGCYSWLQALAGVVFTYADRFLIAADAGNCPARHLCTVRAGGAADPWSAVRRFQVSCFRISAPARRLQIVGPRRVFRLASLISLALSLVLALPLIVFGKPLLTFWMGKQVAGEGRLALALLAVAYALMALNVVPH